jgi:hypothetical protein
MEPAMLAAIQIPVEGETFGKLITIQKTLLNVRHHDNSVYRGERLNAPGSLGNGAVRLGRAEEIQTIDSMKPASMKPDPWNWKDVGGFLV